MDKGADIQGSSILGYGTMILYTFHWFTPRECQTIHFCEIVQIGKVDKLEETLDLDLDIDSDGDLCKAIASKETDRQVEDLESNLVMKIAQIHRVKIPPERAIP